MNLTITNFQSWLAERDIKLSCTPSGQLKVSGNVKLLGPEHADWLRANKPTILAMLRHHEDCPPGGLRLYIGRRAGEAYSRWPLDNSLWECRN